MASRQGKGARKRAKERRKVQKRARKEAAEYLRSGWKSSGSRRKKKRLVKLVKHAVSSCGNLGCIQCHPMFSDPKMAKPGTILYGKQFRQ